MKTLLKSSLLLLAASLCLWAAPAAAQERTGRIVGTIYDDMGMPMAGASITATSPTQIGGAQKATTDAEGSFRFIGLIPGDFLVKVRKGGFLGAARKGIRVSVGKTVTLDILLDKVPVKKAVPGSAAARPPDEPGAPGSAVAPGEVITPEAKAETYVIKAARPVIDVTKSTTGEALSDEYMENLPVLNRTAQGVAGITAQVTQRRNAKGSGGGNPSVAGGAYFNNNYYVDGMDTTDPVTHTFATNFNFDAMADVQVMTGGKGPEYADTPGGVINAITKSGSNEFKLDSSLYYQDDALTIKDLDESGTTFRNLDFNVNIGGPLIRDKLWYYTSFELNESTRSLPIHPDLGKHNPRNYLGGKALIKLTWQPDPKHRISFWTQGAPASISNRYQVITTLNEAESHQNQYNVIGTLAWEWLVGDKMFMKTQFGVGWNGLRVYPEQGNEDLPQIIDVSEGITRQNYSRVTADDRYRFSLNWDLTRFVDDFFGDHELKGGFRLQYLMNPSTELVTGHQVLRYQYGQPYSQTRYFLTFDEGSSCDPTHKKYDREKCTQGTLETTVSGLKLIAFLKDTWKLPKYKRLRLIPGVAMHFGNTINPDGHTVTSFFTATPHINFAWDILGDGKTVFRGGYNQYVDTGFLSLARFIGRDHINYRCNWDKATQTFSSSCSLGGQTRTVGMPQGPTYDKDGKVADKFNPDALTIPRVHEVTVGAEREWLTGFSTGVDFQYRRFMNQWEDLETNVLWNEAGDSADGFKNGKSEYIWDLETPEAAWRRYIGLTVFGRKFIGSWQLMASYTYSHFEGTVAEGYATVYLDRARQEKFFEGYLPDDRRHVFKLTGFYSWNKELNVGGSIWVGTGTPYDKLYYNSFFQDYNDRRAPRGMDPGDLSTPDDDEELRMPTRMVFDLKIAYRLGRVTEWMFGTPLDLELIGEVFNLFNLRTATRYEDRNLAAGAATQFGDVIAKQSPFRVRFGLRYRY